jgi:hypothetical protein
MGVFAALRMTNEDKNKSNYGDSGCARMTTPLGVEYFLRLAAWLAAWLAGLVGGLSDGVEDAHVAGATAEVSGEAFLDL